MNARHSSARNDLRSRPAAIRDARPVPFWLDGPGAPAPRPALTGSDECDLAVVGAGFSGLWTALLAKERDPDRRRRRARRRRRRRPGERPQRRHLHGARSPTVSPGAPSSSRREKRLVAARDENHAAIERTIVREGIDCGWERTGELDIATAPWHVDGLRGSATSTRRLGLGHQWLDREELRADVHSPTYLAGLWHHDAAIVDPARLAWGLARVCAERGVRFYERTPVTALERAAGRRPAARAVGRAARAARRPRDQRLPPAAAAPPPLRRARVRLRPDDGAAERGPAGRPSAGRAGRRWRTPATCSTTTGSPRTGASSGAAGMRCTTTAAASPRGSKTGRTSTPCWPGSSSRPSRSSRACASRTAGPE